MKNSKTTLYVTFILSLLIIGCAINGSTQNLNAASENSVQTKTGNTSTFMPLIFRGPLVLDITREDVQMKAISAWGSVSPHAGYLWYWGPTQRLFTFSEQNATMVVRFNQDDLDFNPTISVNLFSATEDAETIWKWTENQYSDVLFDDAAEPVETVLLDQDNYSITNSEFITQTTSEWGHTYDNYSVQYSVSDVAYADYFQLAGFDGEVIVPIRVNQEDDQ